jgi:hypothetical protein
MEYSIPLAQIFSFSKPERAGERTAKLAKSNMIE